MIIYLIANKNLVSPGQGASDIEYCLGASVWGKFWETPKAFLSKEKAEEYVSEKPNFRKIVPVVVKR